MMKVLRPPTQRQEVCRCLTKSRFIPPAMIVCHGKTAHAVEEDDELSMGSIRTSSLRPDDYCFCFHHGSVDEASMSSCSTSSHDLDAADAPPEKHQRLSIAERFGESRTTLVSANADSHCLDTCPRMPVHDAESTHRRRFSEADAFASNTPPRPPRRSYSPRALLRSVISSDEASFFEIPSIQQPQKGDTVEKQPNGTSVPSSVRKSLFLKKWSSSARSSSFAPSTLSTRGDMESQEAETQSSFAQTPAWSFGEDSSYMFDEVSLGRHRDLSLNEEKLSEGNCNNKEATCSTVLSSARPSLPKEVTTKTLRKQQWSPSPAGDSRVMIARLHSFPPTFDFSENDTFCHSKWKPLKRILL